MTHSSQELSSSFNCALEKHSRKINAMFDQIKEVYNKINPEIHNFGKDHLRLHVEDLSRNNQKRECQDLGQYEKYQETANTLDKSYQFLSKKIKEAKKGTLSPNLVENYNHVVDIFNKMSGRLVDFNEEIKKHNAAQPKGTSAIELLKLPKSLEPLHTNVNGKSYRLEERAEVQKKQDLPVSDLKSLSTKSKVKRRKVAQIHSVSKIAVALLAVTSGLQPANAQLNHSLAINEPKWPRHPASSYDIHKPLSYWDKGTNAEYTKKVDTSSSSKTWKEIYKNLNTLAQRQGRNQYQLHRKARPLNPREKPLLIVLLLWGIAAYLNRLRDPRDAQRG